MMEPITISAEGGYFRVEQGGTHAILSWDEMLGQIASITYPKRLNGAALYRMLNSEEWEKFNKKAVEGK